MVRDAGVDVIHSTTRAEGGPVAALFVTVEKPVIIRKKADL